MPENKNIKIIISGGGTGGHVFPAIAIANSLKKKLSNVSILFVGATGKMEMEKVPAAGYHIIGLNISGLQRKITLKNLSVPFKLLFSILKAKSLIKKFKPNVVVGVGGYASGPILRVATSKKIPTVIQEQNSFPGLTNRILSKKVDKICVAYDGMDQYFPKNKIFLTGNPVRHDVINIEGKKEKALDFFGLNPNKKVLLIIGGSLGARTINECIAANIKLFVYHDIQLIWQTGKNYYSLALENTSGYERFGIKPYDFISRMDYAYAAANVVISRAGAIAVSEICAVNKPAILVPSPNVAEDHQTKNAIALANHNAAILLKDADVSQNLAEYALDLLMDEELQDKLKRNLVGMEYKDAADTIADIIISLIKI